MAHVIITGGGGMLARDLIPALTRHEVTTLGRSELDITDAEAVMAAIPTGAVVINTAAYTQVDAAETQEAAAMSVNADGARILAIASRAVGARLIQISTDYVFDGQASSPYLESSERHPISAYGRSKARAEEFVLAEHPLGTAIIRTAWLYGSNGVNFPAKMLQLASSNEYLSVVSDEFGQPTWTADLAHRISDVIEAGVPAGIFHGTSSGVASRLEFAQATFIAAGLDPNRIRPTTRDSFPSVAARPAYSVLGHEAWATIGMEPLRHWQDALTDAVSAGAINAGRN